MAKGHAGHCRLLPAQLFHPGLATAALEIFNYCHYFLLSTEILLISLMINLVDQLLFISCRTSMMSVQTSAKLSKRVDKEVSLYLKKYPCNFLYHNNLFPGW